MTTPLFDAMVKTVSTELLLPRPAEGEDATAQLSDGGGDEITAELASVRPSPSSSSSGAEETAVTVGVPAGLEAAAAEWALDMLQGGGGGGGGAGAGGPRHVHPSLAALAAWRHAQLLTALPRRETEARAWAAAGARLWRRAGGGGGDNGGGGDGGLADVLGALDCRTGRSLSREGGTVSMLCRRMFVVEGA